MTIKLSHQPENVGGFNYKLHNACILYVNIFLGWCIVANKEVLCNIISSKTIAEVHEATKG